MTFANFSKLFARFSLSTKPIVWNPPGPGFSRLNIHVTVLDIRQVFNRVDVLITPCEGQFQTWTSLENISGVPFEDLL